MTVKNVFESTCLDINFIHSPFSSFVVVLVASPSTNYESHTTGIRHTFTNSVTEALSISVSKFHLVSLHRLVEYVWISWMVLSVCFIKGQQRHFMCMVVTDTKSCVCRWIVKFLKVAALIHQWLPLFIAFHVSETNYIIDFPISLFEKNNNLMQH